jgi:hypothetical protein
MNEEEADRLGLALSNVILEGRFGADGFAIEHVHTGPTFLEGTTVAIEMDGESSDGITVIGLSDTLPTYDAASGRTAWYRSLALISAAGRDRYADFLTYRAEHTPDIAVVELIAQDEDQTTMRAVEWIAGEQRPQDLVINWPRRNPGTRFPAVSNARYLASFQYVTFYESVGKWGASLVDFRAETTAARAQVEAAVRDVSPSFDHAALHTFAKTYETSWKLNRAPVVLATRVSGRSEECCSGAGGTFVRHDLVQDLRGVERSEQTLIRGGHAYYSDEQCGDAYVMGLDAIPTTKSDTFSCDGLSVSELPTYSESGRIVVELEDTPAHREDVGRWHTVYEVAMPDLFADNAPRPWSVPLSLERALTAGTLSWIRISSVTPFQEGFEVMFETTLDLRRYDTSTIYSGKLVFNCGDPRLLVEGSEWLAPLAFSGYPQAVGVMPEGLFLIPGVLLPAVEHTRRAVQEFWR